VYYATLCVKCVTVQVSGGGKGTKNVSYPYFIAFISLLNNMELLKQIISSATADKDSHEVTKGVACFKSFAKLRQFNSF